ncbi:hypothetical protein [Methylocella sp.]|uniref:hypothetical protein n=1 Tax=Methylocella sp. TaxID=1978226 RepID=UPI003783EFA9
MARSKLVSSLFGLALAAAAPAAAFANSLGDVDGMPFFGRPYPYGYVYHRPPAECFDVRPVDTPAGWRWRVTWICDGNVTARY